MMRARRTTAAVIGIAAAFALAVLPAAAASAIALPTFTVAGTIVDPNGVPLVGAKYKLTSGSDDFQVTSTAGGAFSIANVPAGDYASQLFTNVTPGHGLINAFTTIPVGGITNEALVLPFTSDVTGTVTDPSNNPVAGVLVAVSYLDVAFGSTGVSNGGSGTTASGTFDFELDQGRNIVSYAPPSGSDLEYRWFSNVHSASAATIFDPTPDAVGSPFDASVKLATNTDQARGLVTLSGIGVISAAAYLYNSAGDQFAELQSDIAGTYSSAGLPDGDYTVQAHYSNNSGDYISQMQPFTVSGGDVIVPELVLVSDPGPFSTGVPDAYNVAKDSLLNVPAATGVTSNDTRTPAGELFAVVDTFPTHGHLFLQYDGALTYAPDDGFVGVDTFTYKPSYFFPGFGAAGDPTTVTITVGTLANTGIDATTPVAVALLALIAGLGVVVVRRRKTS